MEKILDFEFRNELLQCLKESGMEDEEINNIIKTRYKSALKKAVIDRLSTIIGLIEHDKYYEICQFIDKSPSGDGYGCDNEYISFEDITGLDDIGDVIFELRS